MFQASAQASRVDEWFAQGERLGYDPVARRIDPNADLRIFTRVEGDAKHAVTFLPGFPDGSIGWSRPFESLPDASGMSKLVVEYLGMGDSDKPRGYRYSTLERADLVAALWAYHRVESTTVVAFDFSSLVVLEILRRRLERRATEIPRLRGIFIFNGGLFTDGHTHPWYTTPLLRLRGGEMAPKLGRRSRLAFRMLSRVMWSPHYDLQDDEVADLFDTMNRHDGLFFLSAGAGFVAEHRSLKQRLDFGELFEAYRERIPFVVGGSDEDPFEHRQVDLAQQRLGERGLQIIRLPGGHLTTSEHPRELADAIAAFERSVQ